MFNRLGRACATGAILLAAAACGFAATIASGAGQSPGAGLPPAATVDGNALAMLGRIEPGRWELRVRESRGAVPQILCLPNGSRLIQLRHAGLACDSTVIDDRVSDVTVQYTCHGRGYGRTHIHRENGRLVQVETQGIAEGFPFDLSIEGRRIGDCTG